jgi:hypothetical protein
LAKVLDAIPISSQNETRTFYKWLYTLEDIEIHANNKSVWIITSDAYRYAIESRMKQQVLQSAKSGTKYRYFLPASSRTAPDDYEGELKVLASQSQNNVEYRLFDADIFETQVASDYLVLNPDGDAPLRVFVRLPIADHGEYWFKTDDRSANGFTRRFRNLWDEPKTLAASG